MLQLAERTEATVIAIELEGVPLRTERVERGIAIAQPGIDQAGTGKNEGAPLHGADIRQAAGGPGGCDAKLKGCSASHRNLRVVRMHSDLAARGRVEIVPRDAGADRWNDHPPPLRHL